MPSPPRYFYANLDELRNPYFQKKWGDTYPQTLHVSVSFCFVVVTSGFVFQWEKNI